MDRAEPPLGNQEVVRPPAHGRLARPFTVVAPDSNGTVPKSSVALIAAGLGAVAMIVSLAGSWHVSLWTDESATISAASRSLPDLWKMVHHIDVVHALYYSFMHFWTGAFGISPFALRLPSAILIGFATAGVVQLANRMFGRQQAVVAGMVFTALPRVTWLGIEARPFAVTAALAVWCTLVMLTALREPTDTNARRRLWWILYVALVVLGVAANIYLALLCVAHGLSLLWQSGIGGRRRFSWVIAAAAAGVISAPLLLEAAGQTGQLGGDQLHIGDLARNVLINQWFLGSTPTTTTGVSTTSLTTTDPASWWGPASVALALVGTAVAVFAVYRGFVGRRSESADPSAPFRLLLPWIVVPTTVIGLYSLVVSPLYSPRYLSFATPAVAIVIAVGICELAILRHRIVAVALVLALASPVYLSQRQLYAKSGSDWVSVAAFVAGHKSAGDGVYYTPRYPGAGGPIGQTTRGIAVAYPQNFVGLTDITIALTPPAAQNLTGLSRRLSDSTAELAGLATLWVITRNDYSVASLKADAALLGRSGFVGSVVWRGPLDRILKFDRS